MKEFGIIQLKNLESSGCRAHHGYTEVLKLDKLLDDAGIYHELFRIWDGWGVLYYGHGDTVISDAVEHKGSYGHEQNLLEIMGLCDPDCGDSVEGWLHAEDVFQRWKKHWESEL